MPGKIALMLLLPALCACGESSSPPKEEARAEVPAELPPEGGKAALPDGGWFVWNFNERPKLGVVIVNAGVFAADGSPDTGYEMIGEYGMPTMRYHDSGPKPFVVSKKGRYLLPVDFTMPGEWEIVIRLSRDGKELYEGRRLIVL